MKKNMKILLIIPAYNEERNIENTVNKIINSKQNFDYIIINDGSTDNTKYICEKNDYSTINLVSNLGIGGAVQTGYKYALEHNYDVAIQFDGDGQHDIDSVHKLINQINKGYDIAIGTRFLDKEVSDFKSTKVRRIGIRIISNLIYIFTKKRVTDPTSGFRAVNKNVIKKFADSYPTEFPEPISIVNLLKNKYTYIEVPVKMFERKEGKSSIHSWKNIYYMVNVCFSMFIVAIRRYK